jgi:hypothetical protein
MEMEMEVKDELGLQLTSQWGSQLERLVAAAGALELAAERLRGREIDLAAAGSREAELESKLAQAEATIATLRAAGGRKTVPAGVVTLMAKQGVAAEATSAGALDVALGSLSIEQRIAVKTQMLRAGLVG